MITINITNNINSMKVKNRKLLKQKNQKMEK